MNHSAKQQVQEEHYSFPYHHIPQSYGNAWDIGRQYDWGYVYLSLLEKVKAIIDAERAASLLDFGCGEGRLICELQGTSAKRLAGVDISDQAIAFAKAFNHHGDASFYNSLDVVPKDPRWDAVTSLEVFEHIHPNLLPGILQKLRSLIKDDGMFLLCVPSSNIPVTDKRHFQHFSVDSIQAMCNGLFKPEKFYFLRDKGAGYKILRRMVANSFFVIRWKPWLKLMTKLYTERFLESTAERCSNIIVVLRPI